MQRRILKHLISVTSAALITVQLILSAGHTANAIDRARLKVLDVSQTVNGLTVRVRAARLEGNQARFNVCYPMPEQGIDGYTLRNVTLMADGQNMSSTDGWLDEWLYADGSRILGWQMNSSVGLALFQTKGQPQSRCDWVAFNIRRSTTIDHATLAVGGLGTADKPQTTAYQPANGGLDQVVSEYRSGPWRFELWLK